MNRLPLHLQQPWNQQAALPVKGSYGRKKMPAPVHAPMPSAGRSARPIAVQQHQDMQDNLVACMHACTP